MLLLFPIKLIKLKIVWLARIQAADLFRDEGGWYKWVAYFLVI
jgi:hypothetical protein